MAVRHLHEWNTIANVRHISGRIRRWLYHHFNRSRHSTTMCQYRGLLCHITKLVSKQKSQTISGKFVGYFIHFLDKEVDTLPPSFFFHFFFLFFYFFLFFFYFLQKLYRIIVFIVFYVCVYICVFVCGFVRVAEYLEGNVYSISLLNFIVQCTLF